MGFDPTPGIAGSLRFKVVPPNKLAAIQCQGYYKIMAVTRVRNIFTRDSRAKRDYVKAAIIINNFCAKSQPKLERMIAISRNDQVCSTASDNVGVIIIVYDESINRGSACA